MNALAVEKGPGSIAPLRAELWPFKEGNRQFYPKIDANVTDFVNHFQLCISQAWNGLLMHFQCLKSSAGHWLAIEKGPRSIAPQGAELWPIKEGNRLWNFSKIGDKTLICVQTLVSQAWSGVLQKFKNLEPSE